MLRTEWITGHITFIKALNLPTEQQREFLALAEKTERTPAEDKLLAALSKAERTQEAANKANQRAEGLLRTKQQKEQDQTKKKEIHELIQRGQLFGLAGLGHRSIEELMGCLLTAATIQKEELWESLSAKGAKFFAEQQSPKRIKD
jgi:hypothetical protein